ncbi:uncharacterized protein DDB_G0279979-like, partial [Plectropomus leopardus]|uniref:uncharacterized protein DDB_G0279979-like n=1 Tax=Plectropomus leopardus TaxID=160734 RepID=UPI001C4DC557
MLHQNMKNIPLLSDTDCSEHTKSSRSVPSQERHHEHATADRNSPAKTEITETTRHLTFQQTERELCTDSDATVCELPKSQRQSTQESEEAATAVTMPQTDEMLPAGQTEDAPENLQKKRKKKKKDKGDNENVEERNGQEPEPLHAATSANSPQDDNIQTQEEVDLKEKKKKRKKNKPAAEISQQDMDANLVSDVREEDGGKKKERSGEDVEQLQSESLNYEIKKKKKKKRKREECEDEGTSEMTSNLPQMSTEQLQESVNSLENGAASSQETLGHVKKKKHKKKRHSTSNDVTRDGGESVDLNFCAEDSVNSAKDSGASPKKKTDVLTPEENKVENGNIEETNEIKENNAEVVKKKKKKKKKKNSEMLSSEENVAHDSVSVQEMEKKRTSSFLVADAEEKDAQTDEEQKPLSRVSDAETHETEEFNETKKKRKRKRKRKMSQHFEEADKASALSEMTEAGVKRKKKHHESLERLSPADEAVVLKKKKKKKFKDHLTQEETPLTATDGAESVKSTCSS